MKKNNVFFAGLISLVLISVVFLGCPEEKSDPTAASLTSKEITDFNFDGTGVPATAATLESLDLKTTEAAVASLLTTQAKVFKIKIGSGSPTGVDLSTISGANTAAIGAAIAAAIQDAAQTSGSNVTTTANYDDTTGKITISTGTVVGTSATITVSDDEVADFFGATLTASGTAEVPAGTPREFEISDGTESTTVTLSTNVTNIAGLVTKIEAALKTGGKPAITVKADGTKKFVLTTTAKGKDAVIGIDATDEDDKKFFFETFTAAGKD